MGRSCGFIGTVFLTGVCLLFVAPVLWGQTAPETKATAASLVVAARDNAGRPSARMQAREDRYYAAHLFGDLKDARAVPILIPFLSDEDVNYIVPWALGEIGDQSAVPGLVGALSNKSPDVRVLAIYALEELKAKESLPQIRALLNDNERIHFDGLVTVGQAAEGAVSKLE